MQRRHDSQFGSNLPEFHDLFTVILPQPVWLRVHYRSVWMHRATAIHSIHVREVSTANLESAVLQISALKCNILRM